jgi:methyl-accepting chemotaxis protein
MATIEATLEHPGRKPLQNFVFHGAVQWPQIARNGLLAAFTSLGTACAILWLYDREFGESTVYMLDHSSAFYPVDKFGMFQLLLPAVGGTTLVGLFVGWLLTLGASRRIALPSFKVSRWARKVAGGDLSARVGFRTGDGLEDLADSCNSAVDGFRAGVLELELLRQDEKIPEEVRIRLGEILSRYKL